MGRSTFTPPRGLDDPAIAALAECFATNDGIAVLHHTIQYLRERARDERRWLEALAESSTPTTLVWGVFDDVSPVRVANHVWQAYLRGKPGSNEYWLLPAANHYLQDDQPDALVDVLLASFDRTGPAAPGPLSPSIGAPIRVDHSSTIGLPAAEDAPRRTLRGVGEVSDAGQPGSSEHNGIVATKAERQPHINLWSNDDASRATAQRRPVRRLQHRVPPVSLRRCSRLGSTYLRDQGNGHHHPGRRRRCKARVASDVSELAHRTDGPSRLGTQE